MSARDAARPSAPDFLTGGGETGALIRAHDWSSTPLGPPDDWPPPLKTLVGVMLAGNQPMFVAWGPERTLLYNDAYAEVAASKHPSALGRDFLEVWSEIRADLTPIVEKAYAGEPVHMDDIELLMNRRGYPEETHFSFSYTPVRDEAGAVAGFFCPCVEITEQVLSQRRRTADAERQRQLFEQAPGFITILKGPDHVFEFGNAAYRRLVGDRDTLGRTVRDALPEVEGQGFFELLDRVYATGERFVAHHVPIRLEGPSGLPEERFLDFIYEPVTDDAGRVTGIFVEGHDVTEVHRAQEALRESQARVRALTDHLPAGMVYQIATGADGRERRFLYVSQSHEKLTGVPAEAVLADPAIAYELIVPEDRARLVEAEADAVRTKRPFDVEARFRRADGEVRWCRIISAPREQTDGSLVWDGIQIDTTEQKRAEAELRESEARFRVLADAMPILVWTAGADGRVDYYNARQFEYAGLTQATPGQYDWGPVVHPEDLERTRAAWSASAATGAPYACEHRLARADGSWAWHVSRAECARGADGTVERWYGTAVDIADLKAAQQSADAINATLEQRVAERTAERNLLATLVETTDAYIQALDLDYRWLAINASCTDAYERIYGRRPEVGDCLLEMLADRPEQRAAVRSLWARALAGEAFTQIEEFGDPTLDSRTFEMRFEPLRDADGSRIGAFLTGTDVTERMREQARLAQAEEQLRQSQKLEAMGQLTGGVAHDVNNLLTPIMGSLDLLQRKGLGGERERRLIDGALQSAERARTLVQRLLAFARRQPLQPGAVDVGAVIAGMADLVASTSGPRVRVDLDIAPDLPAARADANQLEMALLNLSVNARDAMPDGGRLIIGATPEAVGAGHRAGLAPGDYVRLSVADTGVGMDEATLARAVEPFFSTKGVGQGTGLGLSMAHGLAAQLGGALALSSRPGVGTNVELWLPVSREAAKAKEGAPGADAPTSTGTALLVDDEELVRMSTADMLADLGYAVVEASSAEAALDLLSGGLRPSLILTDHLMPGMTGAELAREVALSRPGLPVLIVSGYAELDGIAPDLKRLTKPFRRDDLATKLSELERAT